ncbi:MAG: hypothetical protein JSR82_00525 [Verrucomicrobia bacterium]|nr:hypothetical protein [Verrucomicrobiota bacterium]
MKPAVSLLLSALLATRLLSAADRVANDFPFHPEEVIDAAFATRLAPSRWDSLAGRYPNVYVVFVHSNGTESLPYGPAATDPYGRDLSGPLSDGFVRLASISDSFQFLRLRQAQFFYNAQNEPVGAAGGKVVVRLVREVTRDVYSYDSENDFWTHVPRETLITQDPLFVATLSPGTEQPLLDVSNVADPDGPWSGARPIDIVGSVCHVEVDIQSLNPPPDPNDGYRLVRLTPGRKYELTVSARDFRVSAFVPGYRPDAATTLDLYQRSLPGPNGLGWVNVIRGVLPEESGPGEGAELRFYISGDESLAWLAELGAAYPANAHADFGNYALDFTLVDVDQQTIFGSVGTTGDFTAYRDCFFADGVTLLGEARLLGLQTRIAARLTAEALTLPAGVTAFDNSNNALLAALSLGSGPIRSGGATFSLLPATQQAMAIATSHGLHSDTIAAIVASGAGGGIVAAGAGLTPPARAAIVAAGAGFDAATVSAIVAAGAGNPVLPVGAIAEIVGAGAGLNEAQLDAILASHGVSGLHPLTRAAIVASGAGGGLTVASAEAIARAGGGIVASGAGGGIVTPGAGAGLAPQLSSAIVAVGAGAGIVGAGAGAGLAPEVFSKLAAVEGKLLPATLAQQLSTASIVAAGAGGLTLPQLASIVAAGAGGGFLSNGAGLQPSALFSAGGLTLDASTRSLDIGGALLGNVSLFPPGSVRAPLARTDAAPSQTTLRGLVAPGCRGVGLIETSGALIFGAGALLDLEIFATGDGDLVHDEIKIAGAVTLGGLLQVSLWEGAGATPAFGSRTFRLVRSGGLPLGQFANAPAGSRLATAGGEGTFLVGYDAEGVTLSLFQPLPPPAPTEYAAWKQHYGIPQAADTDDTDGDGFSTLAEFAWNLDPARSDRPAGLYVAGGQFFVPVDRRKAVRYLVEHASRPDGPWTVLFDSALDPQPRPGLVELVPVPVPGGPRAFLRARASTP